MRIYKLLILAILIGFGGTEIQAKKYNLEYDLNQGDSFTYKAEILSNNYLMVDGVRDMNRSSLNYLAEFYLVEKTKDNTYNFALKISDVSIKTFWGETETGHIVLKSGSLEKAVLFNLSDKGEITIKEGIDKELNALKIDRTAKNALLKTFSKQNIDENIRQFFPLYPDNKISANTVWKTDFKNLGHLKLNILSKSRIKPTNEALTIYRHDSIPLQTIKFPFSGFKASYNILGIQNGVSEITYKSGLTRNTSFNSTLKSSDNLTKIVLNYHIKLVE